MIKEFLSLKWYFKLGVILLIGVIFVFVALQVVRIIDYVNSDFFTFWLAGHMLWTGQNPYSTSEWIGASRQFGVTWIPNGSFVYPLPLAFFYAPLGLLPFYSAFITWIFTLQVFISLSVLALISLRVTPRVKPYILPILAGAILFRPTFTNLLGGQISGLLLLLLTCGIWMWQKEKWLWGGALLALVALKPNIGGPILVLLMPWLFTRMRLKAFAGFAISGLILLGIGMLLNPAWVMQYLTIGSSKMSETFGFSPTLWGLAGWITGFVLRPTILLGGVGVAILLGGVFYLVWRQRKTITPIWMVGLAITTTLLVTPYTWPYDQLLLLIPIITILLEMADRQYPFLLTASAFLALDMIAIVLLIVSMRISVEIPSVLTPLIVFGGLVFCLVTKKDRIPEPAVGTG